MNRFGGADLLSHSGALGGLDALPGRLFDFTRRGDLPYHRCPQGGRITVIAPHNVLDRGLRPGRE